MIGIRAFNVLLSLMSFRKLSLISFMKHFAPLFIESLVVPLTHVKILVNQLSSNLQAENVT